MRHFNIITAVKADSPTYLAFHPLRIITIKIHKCTQIAVVAGVECKLSRFFVKFPVSNQSWACIVFHKVGNLISTEGTAENPEIVQSPIKRVILCGSPLAKVDH